MLNAFISFIRADTHTQLCHIRDLTTYGPRREKTCLWGFRHSEI